MPASKELRALLAATVQAVGANWGPETLPVILEDLAIYPEDLVMQALVRCRRELRFKLTLADIVERIDDGRPTADEAWAQVSAGLDERCTVVATEEALEALGEVRHLAGDQNAVRMGFRAAYHRIVTRNKGAGILPKWIASLGHDPEGRERALREAADRGRIESVQITGLLGAATPSVLALPAHGEDSRQAEAQRQLARILSSLSEGVKADRKRLSDREPRFDWNAENERLAAQQALLHPESDKKEAA